MKKTIILYLLLIFGILLFINPRNVLAQQQKQICCPTGYGTGADFCPTNNTIGGRVSSIARIIDRNTNKPCCKKNPPLVNVSEIGVTYDYEKSIACPNSTAAQLSQPQPAKGQQPAKTSRTFTITMDSGIERVNLTNPDPDPEKRESIIRCFSDGRDPKKAKKNDNYAVSKIDNTTCKVTQTKEEPVSIAVWSLRDSLNRVDKIVVTSVNGKDSRICRKPDEPITVEPDIFLRGFSCYDDTYDVLWDGDLEIKVSSKQIPPLTTVQNQPAQGATTLSKNDASIDAKTDQKDQADNAFQYMVQVQMDDGIASVNVEFPDQNGQPKCILNGASDTEPSYMLGSDSSGCIYSKQKAGFFVSTSAKRVGNIKVGAYIKEGYSFDEWVFPDSCSNAGTGWLNCQIDNKVDIITLVAKSKATLNEARFGLQQAVQPAKQSSQIAKCGPIKSITIDGQEKDSITVKPEQAGRVVHIIVTCQNGRQIPQDITVKYQPNADCSKETMDEQHGWEFAGCKQDTCGVDLFACKANPSVIVSKDNPGGDCAKPIRNSKCETAPVQPQDLKRDCDTPGYRDGDSKQCVDASSCTYSVNECDNTYHWHKVNETNCNLAPDNCKPSQQQTKTCASLGLHDGWNDQQTGKCAGCQPGQGEDRVRYCENGNVTVDRGECRDGYPGCPRSSESDPCAGTPPGNGYELDGCNSNVCGEEIWHCFAKPNVRKVVPNRDGNCGKNQYNPACKCHEEARDLESSGKPGCAQNYNICDNEPDQLVGGEYDINNPANSCPY